MSSQIVEIKVSIPDGYVFDSFRIPYPGDLYLVDGSVRERKCDTSIGFPCLIVKKDWVWPAWLRAGWIAQDKDGEWYGYNCQPSLNADGGRWDAPALSDDPIINLEPDIVAFEPPHCENWMRSLRANPAYAR
jgi:hypothetical protein